MEKYWPARTCRRACALPLIGLLSTLGSDVAAFAPSRLSVASRVASPPPSLTSLAAVKAASPESSTSSRLKRTTAFTGWAKDNDVKYAGIEVSSGKEQNSGLGLYATQALTPNDVVIQVPTKLTLSVESPQDYNTVMEKELFASNPKAYRSAPWWAALSIQLNYYDKVNPINQGAGGVSMKPWMDSLPRAYDTPIHWSESSLDELQYRPMIEAGKSIEII